MRREIAQNGAPRYIFAARVKIVPPLEEFTARACAKKIIILAPLLEMLLVLQVAACGTAVQKLVLQIGLLCHGGKGESHIYVTLANSWNKLS
jgi:hypothetical protein